MKNKDRSYARIIKAVNTPLGFYALVVLFLESFLLIILKFSELTEEHKFYGILIAASLLLVVIGIVAFLVWHKKDIRKIYPQA